MAKSKLAEAYVDLKVEGENRLKASFGRIRTDTERTHGKLLLLRRAVSGLFAGAISAVGVGAFFRGVIQNSKEGEDAVTKLRATLRALDRESEFERLNSFADALKGISNEDDDAIRGLISLGLNLGVTTDQIENVTKAAIGLSEATGTDTETAMLSLTKAVQGNFTALGKLIPAVRNATSNEQKLAEIQRAANRGMQERQAVTQTLSGSTKRLDLAIGDLQKSVGAALTPALIAAANAAATLFGYLTTGTAENERAVIEYVAWWKRLEIAITETTQKIVGKGIIPDSALDDLKADLEWLAKESQKVQGKRADPKMGVAGQLNATAEAAKRAKIGLADMFAENARMTEMNLRSSQNAFANRSAEEAKRAEAAKERNEANRPKNMPKAESQKITPEAAAEIRQRNDEERTKNATDMARRMNNRLAQQSKGLGPAGQYNLDKIANAEMQKARDVAKAGGTQNDYLKTKTGKTPEDDPIVRELKKVNTKLDRPATYAK